MSVIASAWRSVLGPGLSARGGPVAVLDVGTSKLCCYIVRPRGNRGLQLLGRGYQLAEGMKAGEIVDAEEAETSILAAVHEAEQQAGTRVREVVIALSGGSPHSSYVTAETPLHGREVNEDEIRRLLERARRGSIEPDHEVLHVIPLETRIDGGRPLQDPRGMRGEKLELLAHVVSVAAAPLRNLVACVERCHLEARTVVAAAYAAGLSVLGDDEIDRGCLVIDMGGGQTGLAHFAGGKLALVEQVPYGGEHVTADLAWGLSTSRSHAERIKNLFGNVQWRSCDDSSRIEVPLLGDRADQPTGEYPRTRVTQIVRARVEEIFLLAQDRLREHGDLLRSLPPRSLVLTGGASQLEGVEELAQEMFGLPVRRGRPAVVESADSRDEDPCCAAASGSIVLALGDDGGLRWTDAPEGAAMVSHGLARIGQWLRENF